VDECGFGVEGEVGRLSRWEAGGYGGVIVEVRPRAISCKVEKGSTSVGWWGEGSLCRSSFWDSGCLKRGDACRRRVNVKTSDP